MCDIISTIVDNKYKGYQIMERYGKNYIRFWGGREEDMPCEIPISEDDVNLILADASVIDEMISKAKMQIEWTADSFYRIGIFEYFLHHMKLSETLANKFYDYIARHADILKEFYQYIMNDETFTSNPLIVEGYTAQDLETRYPLSPLGAYNYLIFLREKPDRALANLKAGLPTKDSRIVEQISQQEEAQATYEANSDTSSEN